VTKTLNADPELVLHSILVARSLSLSKCGGIHLSATLMDCQRRGIVLRASVTAQIIWHTFTEEVILNSVHPSLAAPVFVC